LTEGLQKRLLNFYKCSSKFFRSRAV
jgi:hypothetical protein